MQTVFFQLGENNAKKQQTVDHVFSTDLIVVMS